MMLTAQARELLRGPNFGVIATLNADGTPQQSVVWVAGRDGDMTVGQGLGQPDLLVAAAGLSAAHTRMSEDEAERLVARYWGLSGHATRLATEKDDAFAVRAGHRGAYILKVSNPIEDSLEVDFEIQLMRHVARTGSFVLVPQVFDALDGRQLIALEDAAGQPRQARLMSFIAGTSLDSTTSSPAER
jgi:hydroxylysine kinase